MTQQYVDDLVTSYPGIREVWLIGSRANGTSTDKSDWDYLAFLADDRILNALAHDLHFYQKGIDLFVVSTSSDIACCPWTDAKEHRNTLGLGDKPGGLDWRPLSAVEANYRVKSRTDESPDNTATESRPANAVRVYPFT